MHKRISKGVEFLNTWFPGWELSITLKDLSTLVTKNSPICKLFRVRSIWHLPEWLYLDEKELHEMGFYPYLEDYVKDSVYLDTLWKIHIETARFAKLLAVSASSNLPIVPGLSALDKTTSIGDNIHNQRSR